MKKIILSIALVTGLTMAGYAQDTKSAAGTTKGDKKKNGTPEERAKASANHAEKKLGLTADQKSKWEAATLTRINANAPHREKWKGSTTPDERKTLHSQMKANIDKFDADVNGFLTADQKTKFTQIKEERKKKMKEKHKGKQDHEMIDDEN